MLDDTQTSMAIYPSNKTISIGDRNVSGINIATNGAAFTANTIQLGSATTTTKVNGTLSTGNIQTNNGTLNTGSGNITTTGTITGGTLSMGSGNITTSGTVTGGTMTCTGELFVGTNQLDGTGVQTSGTIRFGAPYGDPGALITCRRYSTAAASEFAELVIYQGNDGVSSTGPDRIRLKSPQILFDTFSDYTNDPSTVTTKMMINDNGRVGIGTTDPQNLLHVNGTAQLSNYIISSDRRIKTSIADVSQALDLFRTFRPRMYH